MIANIIARVQPGVPSGGQFAAGDAHAETDVSLAADPAASIVDRDNQKPGRHSPGRPHVHYD